jgi:hypothetical protein
MTVFAADEGTKFGTWGDPTSQLLYRDVMPVFLSGVDTSYRVFDLGGANGLLRHFIPHALTVDIDPTKAPDVVADCLKWKPKWFPRPSLAVLRYVLHYLTDTQATKLFNHLATWADRVLVIQFVTDPEHLAAKTHNSVNEVKWFRSEPELLALLGEWKVLDRKRLDFTVDAEFYRRRLLHPNPISHPEGVVALYLTR